MIAGDHGASARAAGPDRTRRSRLAGLDARERDSAEMRAALASLRLAQHDPQAATAALAPVIDGSVRPGLQPVWVVAALLLEAIARDALGDPAAAGRALERALDLAEPDRVLIPFLVHPAPGLLERQARHAHRARRPDRRDPEPARGTSRRGAAPPGRTTAKPARAAQPGEIRVLRYLPTSLSVPEIAGQLLPVGEHRPDAHAPPVRQARRAPPPRGRRAGPRPRPARTLHAGLRG